MSTNTKGIGCYLLLTFGMAWIAWEIPLRLGVPLQSAAFMVAALPGAFAPALAAIIVRRWITREGFADAGLRPNLRHWRYYLVAWLLPLGMVTTIALLATALGIGRPDFSLARAAQALPPGTLHGPIPAPWYFWGLMVAQTLVGSLVATVVLWGEEFGWRGYLQMRLLAERPLAAAVATGLIWGVWHYPINLRGYNFPEHPYLGLAVFPIGTVLLSIILGWLRLRTGSVWAPSLGHAAMNATAGSLTLLLFMGGADMLFVNPLGLLGWIPLGALCAWIVWSGQLRPQPATEPVGAVAGEPGPSVPA